jgi:4-alpha-glucanotransferase
MTRASGILLPVFSIPSKYGIGCFSKEAYTFIDQLNQAGQKYWQLLPLGPTSYGDSPYQSFSTFAGNPYFIDLERLILEGLLEQEECDIIEFGYDDRYIDYGQIYQERKDILWKAFKRSKVEVEDNYKTFVQENKEWLPDYALFMAVKSQFGDRSWIEWDEDIRTREGLAIEKYKELLQEEIAYYYFVQYKFKEQWLELKSYANEKGIQIIGDIPIYVALDSADTWTRPELFQMDKNRMPTAQAGCPPDGFSATGQLWGNPLYNWEYHKETDYEWWCNRVAYHQRLYDVVRIDHFRGLDEYYSIPWGALTAEIGEWRRGPGYDIFKVLSKKLGTLNVIAEDLGFLTEGVFKLLADTKYPGMKVLQFAFDSRESGDYLPHNYIHNCIVYTGTHDNDTTKSWYQSIRDEEREYILEYLGRKDTEVTDNEITWRLISMAQSSVAKLCVIPVQDYLGLGAEGRINTPSTLGGNWTWRLRDGEIMEELIKQIRQMTQLYGRV